MPLTAEHGVLAIAKSTSGNKKIGVAGATYAAQASCPSSCAFFEGGGCYAENGTLYSGITKPLNDAARIVGATALQVAVAEADAIDELVVIPGRPLRLHTVGDCRTDTAAMIVAAACARYVQRGGGTCWAYTHGWQIVDRASWGDVSVLASCETPEQVELAHKRGYATALVVNEHEDAQLHDGVLPCPQQTSGVACSDCRLCMNDQGLRARGYSIGFEIHGTAFTVRQARAALRDPSSTRRRLTLRTLIPEYLEQHPDATDRQIARALDYNVASVTEMRLKLEQELIAA